MSKFDRNGHSIISYVKETRETFKEKPFNEVDSLILSWLVYLDIPKTFEKIRTQEGIRLKDLFKMEYFEEEVDIIVFRKKTLKLLSYASASPRFRDVKLFLYRDHFDTSLEKQFAAITFELWPGICYVAFRGTDIRYTGWKEDLNLALAEPIPSQVEATEYLNEIGELPIRKLIVGGHSKGGNLAIYSSLSCKPEVEKKIVRIFSHDGPGIPEHLLKDLRVDSAEAKIRKTVPQSSLVGMIFEQEGKYKIVKSNGFWLTQHDPFTWRVEKNAFRRKNKQTLYSIFIHRTLNSWIKELNYEEREGIINLTFDILDTTGTADFLGLFKRLHKTFPVIVKEMFKMDRKSRKLVFHAVWKYICCGFRVLPGLIKK